MNATTYTSLTAEKGNLVRSINQMRHSGQFPSQETIARVDEITFILNAMPTVCVEFYIGYRRYYRSVVKLGKTYFDDGHKMTKSRGYRDIQEIESITDKMKKEMIEDSYYY